MTVEPKVVLNEEEKKWVVEKDNKDEAPRGERRRKASNAYNVLAEGLEKMI